MKIKINDILEEGIDLQFKENPVLLNIEHDQLEKLDEVSVSVHLQKEDFGFLAFGEINAKWSLICNRCLTSFPQEVKIEFNREYRLSEENTEEEEIKEEDLNTVIFKGDEIDLEKEIREDLFLAIPIKTLCKTECKGICAQCGQNLNIKKCSCTQEEIDIRWEALKEIKDKLKSQVKSHKQ